LPLLGSFRDGAGRAEARLYPFSPEEYVQLVSGAFYLRLERSFAYGNQRLKKRYRRGLRGI
jgi:hypothetical protein